MRKITLEHGYLTTDCLLVANTPISVAHAVTWHTWHIFDQLDLKKRSGKC